MLPYLIAGAIGFGIGKLFENEGEAGEKYVNGGGVGKYKMYKLRAEGLNDFINFLGTGVYFNIKSFTVEPIGVPDVVVSFETNLSLSEIKAKLREVKDSHVMLETIKPIKEYTGERYAGGGEITDADLNYYIYSTKQVRIAYLGKIQMGAYFSLKDALKEIEYLTMAYPKNEIEKYAIITPDKTFHLGKKEYNIRFDNGGEAERKSFGEVYDDVVKYIMDDQKISYDDAVAIIDEQNMEAWIRDMVESEEEYNAEFLAEQILSTDEGTYANGGGLPKKRRRSASLQYGRSDTSFDKQLTAKPVGYRFTNAKANQLRKDPFAKPTEAQVKKYLGKGIYKENRRNRSDRDRNAKL